MARETAEEPMTAVATLPHADGWRNIPEALKAYPAWVCWRYVHRGEKLTKIPFIAQGGPRRKAKVNDPTTWRTFDEAVKYASRFAGIGIMLDDGLAGADLDDSMNGDGTPKPWAATILCELDSYSEISPSGTGVKVLFFGEIPEGGNRKKVEDGEIELYSHGRFFTLTGQHLPGTPETVEPRQAQIEAVHGRLFGSAGTKAPAPPQPPPSRADLTDEDILEKARNAGDGEKFRRLYDDGDVSAYAADDSAADCALAGMIAFWCGPNPERIERLCSRSALGQREKWRSRPDYRQRTIDYVLKGRTEFYRPPCRHRAKRVTNPMGTRSHAIKSHILQLNPTDAGNGEVLADLYGDQLRYDWKRERWLKWGGHSWGTATTGELITLAKLAARERYVAASAAADEQQRQWAFGSESRSRAEAALYFARSEPPISDNGEAWDADPMLLGCPNGVVELNSGIFRSGRREDRLTRIVVVRYDERARCPRWEQFLEEVFCGDRELTDFLWRSIGYSLTGSIREQIFWLLHGQGSNGKSLFLGTLRYVLGDLAYSASFSLFDYSCRDAHPQNLAQLEARRFVTAAESAESCRLNEDRIKALTGGEPITAHLMRENDRTFPNTSKLWLSVNHLPRVFDDSDAFWRRARLVPFSRRFVDAEKPESDPALARDPAVLLADKELLDALKAEASGILRWAVAGAVAWAKEGLREPESVKLASQSWRDEVDPLSDFLGVCCTLNDDCVVLAGDLYRAYVRYCEDCGIRERDRMTQTMFGRRFGARFEKKPRVSIGGRKGPAYVGVGLREEKEE
jgi:putative DNA primase/helicase